MSDFNEKFLLAKVDPVQQPFIVCTRNTVVEETEQETSVDLLTEHPIFRKPLINILGKVNLL